MRVKILKGFIDKDQFTRVVGAEAVFDTAYADTLIESGHVEPVEIKKSEKKARSRKNAINSRENS